MRVLVVEREAGLGDTVVEVLGAAGEDVVRCHGPGMPAFPCNAMLEPEGCPLEHRAVDVAVAVRGAGGGPTSEDEDGVRCAMRHRVPVVVVGGAVGASYAGWVERVLAETEGDLVAEVAEAARAGFERHASAAREAMDHVLDQHSTARSGVHVEVGREDKRLRCVLRVDGIIDPKVAQMAAVRVLVALRSVDHDFPVIDVEVIDSEGTSRRLDQ